MFSFQAQCDYPRISLVRSTCFFRLPTMNLLRLPPDQGRAELHQTTNYQSQGVSDDAPTPNSLPPLHPTHNPHPPKMVCCLGNSASTSTALVSPVMAVGFHSWVEGLITILLTKCWIRVALVQNSRWWPELRATTCFCSRHNHVRQSLMNPRILTGWKMCSIHMEMGRVDTRDTANWSLLLLS